MAERYQVSSNPTAVSPVLWPPAPARIIRWDDPVPGPSGVAVFAAPPGLKITIDPEEEAPRAVPIGLSIVFGRGRRAGGGRRVIKKGLPA